MEYNQIPKTGTIGGMVDNINANFQLTKEMLERIQLSKDNSRGLFTTAAALQAAYPTPEVGDWAIVGSTSPFDIYICSTAGTWADSGNDYNGGEVNLSEYAKKASVDSLASTVSSEASRLRTDEAWLQRVDNDNMANGRQITTLGSQLTDMKTVDDRQDSDIEGIKEDLRNLNPVVVEGNVTNNPDNVFLTSANDEITPKERTTSLSAKGHYIMRPTDDFAAKLKANYIHEIPFDVDLGGASVTIPANAVLKFVGGKITNGSIVLQNTYLDGDVKLSADVAVSGTCANLTAKQSWFADNDVDAWHRFIHSVDVPTYEYVQGEYHPTTILQADNRKVVTIKGNGAKLIWTTPTSDIENVNSGGITINRNFTNYTPITVAAFIPYHSHEITVESGHGLAVGDLIVLLDKRENSFLPNFLNGEYLRVRTVDGNTIGLASKTYAQYPSAADIVAAKVEQTTVNISDLTVECMTEQESGENRLRWGVAVWNSEGTIRGVKANGFSFGIGVQYCCGINVDGCVVTPLQRISLDRTAHYGVQINNCQDTKVVNSSITGGQHGVTTGGYGYYQSFPNIFNVPCREITLANNVITNEQMVNWASVGFHQNIEYAIVTGNVLGGISVAGSMTVVTNNIIRTSVNANGYAITLPLTYNHVFANNLMEESYIAISSKRISRTDYPNVYDDGMAEQLVIANNVCKYGLRLTASKGDASKVVRANVTGNKFQSSPNISSQIKCDFDEIDLSDNFFDDVNGVGCVSLGALKNITFRNCTFRSNSKGNASLTMGGNEGYFGNVFTAESIKIDGCKFIGDGGYWRIGQMVNTGNAEVGMLTLTGNYFAKHSNGKTQAMKLLGNKTIKTLVIDGNMVEEETSENYFEGAVVTAKLGTNYYGNIADGTKTHSAITADNVTDRKGVSLYKIGKGTTAQRPALAVGDAGLRYFDETLNTPLYCATKKEHVINAVVYTATGYVAVENTLTEGERYLFYNGNTSTGTKIVAFSKVSSNPTDDDLLKVYEGNAISMPQTYYTAPDPSVYPYVYFANSAGSNLRCYVDSVTPTWCEADGAVAGTNRSGTTTQRPTGSAIYVGYRYFDTTLGKPIFAKSISGDTVTWVDATGATV